MLSKKRKSLLYLLSLSIFIIISLYSLQIYNEVQKYYNPQVPSFSNNYFLADEEYGELGYIVNTPSCSIVNISAWDKAVVPFLKRERDWPDCHTNSRQWTYSSGQNLVLNISSIQKSGFSESSIVCCYKTITRVEQSMDNFDMNADVKVDFSKECHMLENVNTVMNVEFVRVLCRGKYWPLSSDVLYRNFHAFSLPPHLKINTNGPSSLKTKINHWTELNEKNNKEIPPSVLIVGIDSMSRLSFIRNMPKTRGFLEKVGAIELLGYTKVGENTLPNAVSFLTGHSESEIIKLCHSGPEVPFDSCPFIWKNYSNSGYITGVVEDAPLLAIFNYLKTGFIAQPTDYFFRTFMLGVHQHTPNPDFTIPCIGSLTVDELLLNYMSHLIKMSQTEHLPLFLFSWLTNLAHGDIVGAQSADETYVNFLSSLNLENSFLFFMSDHGYRYGGIRQTLPGWYEDKLPNFWSFIPVKYRKMYPEWYQNLKDNSKKLTSPFDLYKTLSHILAQFSPETSKDDKKLPKISNNSHNKLNSSSLLGYSLFSKIPSDRQCKDAGISDNFCACVVPKKLPTSDKLLNLAAKSAVKFINNFLPTSCSELKLVKVRAGAVLTQKKSKKTTTASLNSDKNSQNRASVNNIFDKVVKNSDKSYKNSDVKNSDEFSHKNKNSVIGDKTTQFTPNHNEKIDKSVKNSDKNIRDKESIIVAFETEPGGFLFEANVGRNEINNELEVTSEILRMSKISTDVSCVTDSTLEKYCFCDRSQDKSKN